jgi:ABC-2 type transport system permease protein
MRPGVRRLDDDAPRCDHAHDRRLAAYRPHRPPRPCRARAAMIRSVRELWAYRYLVWNLAQRDLRSRYKKSVLGWMWSLINPASTLIIFTIVFGYLLQQKAPPARNGNDTFGLWLFSGLVVWNFFSSVVNGSILALSTSGGLLKKVYFPASSPAVANLLVAGSQAVIEFFILGVFLTVWGNFSVAMFLFPIVLVLVGLFALGIGLWVSILNLFYRDIGYLVGIALNILFYATPIVYSLENTIGNKTFKGVELATLIKLNPVADLVELNRAIFYHGNFDWVPFLYILVATAGSLAWGTYMFNRKAQYVSEEI